MDNSAPAIAVDADTDAVTGVSTRAACAQACTQHASCQYWTVADDKKCLLRESYEPVTSHLRHIVTGTKNCDFQANNPPCKIESGKKYEGNDLPGESYENTNSAEECAILCAGHPDCKFWTFKGTGPMLPKFICKLKDSDQGTRPKSKWTSGQRECGFLLGAGITLKDMPVKILITPHSRLCHAPSY
jgi:hypothetical protein